MKDKPSGWITCPHCLGTTYIYTQNKQTSMNSMTGSMTNKKCQNCQGGFIELE